MTWKGNDKNRVAGESLHRKFSFIWKGNSWLQSYSSQANKPSTEVTRQKTICPKWACSFELNRIYLCQQKRVTEHVDYMPYRAGYAENKFK